MAYISYFGVVPKDIVVPLVVFLSPKSANIFLDTFKEISLDPRDYKFLTMTKFSRVYHISTDITDVNYTNLYKSLLKIYSSLEEYLPSKIYTFREESSLRSIPAINHVVLAINYYSDQSTIKEFDEISKVYIYHKYNAIYDKVKDSMMNGYFSNILKDIDKLSSFHVEGSSRELLWHILGEHISRRLTDPRILFASLDKSVSTFHKWPFLYVLAISVLCRLAIQHDWHDIDIASGLKSKLKSELNKILPILIRFFEEKSKDISEFLRINLNLTNSRKLH